jgi:aminopeptidase N
VKQLGTLNNGEFKSIFNITLNDPNSKVRAAALVALADIDDKDIIPLCRKIFEEDESYLVLAEAVKLIGKYGDKTQLSFLQEARKMESTRDVVSQAAGQAIDMIKNEN